MGKLKKGVWVGGGVLRKLEIGTRLGYGKPLGNYGQLLTVKSPF